jgi:hypothetical protein
MPPGEEFFLIMTGFVISTSACGWDENLLPGSRINS